MRGAPNSSLREWLDNNESLFIPTDGAHEYAEARHRILTRFRALCIFRA